MAPKIYEVSWGEIEVYEFISEAPGSFLVKDARGREWRVWKCRRYQGFEGGATFQTHRSFIHPKPAAEYAREQVISYLAWAEHFSKRGKEIGDKLEKSLMESNKAKRGDDA